MRLLIVTHAPLAPEYGAAQVALNLAAALSARGHEAIAWSTEPLPAGVPWWQRWRRQRRRLEAYLEASPPFDAIDLPPVSASPRAAAAPLVARSVQPDLRYFASGLAAGLARLPRGAPHLAAETLLHFAIAAAIVAGWRRARWILCLGSHERRWMHRRLPWTRPRLLTYVNAVGDDDRRLLAAVRSGRARPARPDLSFLWIGRWVPHKGTRRLARFLRRRAAARPGDRFTLAGCGDAAGGSLARQLLASGGVRLVPSFTRAELPGLLADHDAGLFTSSVEGWGLSLNEMLESGMPVFATEAGGVEDLAPFFPRGLLPFPPPRDGALPGAPDEIDANGFTERFTWEAIAARYEREVLAPLGAAAARGRGPGR
jgi:glycosyltransferase involved in cell wall biosynthesis